MTFMGSFAILKGPSEHLRSMLTYDRAHFTLAWLGSMAMTLYLTFTAGGARGYVLVMASSGCQLLALLWYLITFLPGGGDGDEAPHAGYVDAAEAALRGLREAAGDVH